MIDGVLFYWIILILNFLCAYCYRHPSLQLRSLTSRAGCIVIDLDLCLHEDFAHSGMSAAGEERGINLQPAEILDLLDVQDLIKDNDSAVSIMVCVIEANLMDLGVGWISAS